MKKILSITGPTSSGKSQKALSLTEKFLQENPAGQVILISADSKQIYQELPILTGADIPANWTREPGKNSLLGKTPFPFFKHPNNKIELHGIGILAGDKGWGAGEFAQLAKSLLEKTVASQTLFIIVGGTGYYYQQLLFPAKSLGFKLKPNQKLRQELASLPVSELQRKLKTTWPGRFTQMNHSDQNNPRRLIRALEIAQEITDPSKLQAPATIKPNYNCQPYFLDVANEKLAQKISQRIDQRLKQGVLDEVTNFEKKYPQANLLAKTALGYQEIKDYLQQKNSLEELKKNWLTKELQYAKRQKTWWKKYL